MAVVRAAPRPAARPAVRPTGRGAVLMERPTLAAAPVYPWQPRIFAAPGADPDGDPALWRWVDISQWLHDPAGVQITAGRSPTSSTAEPAKVTFKLDNRTGRWTPQNARSPWYGMVGENLPIMVVVGWSCRGWGLVDAGGWQVSWDGGLCLVDVSASGRLRKESQKSRPARSPLTRTIRAELPDGCRGWWPCEEAADALFAASPVPGVEPATPDGNVKFAGFAKDRSAGGTQTFGFSAMPDLSAGGRILGRALQGASPSSWTFKFFGGGEWIQYTGTTFTPVDTPLMDWDTPGGTYAWWRVVLTTANRVELRAYTPANAPTLVAHVDSTGGPVWEYQVEATQVGGNIVCALRAQGYDAGGTVAGTLSAVTNWRANPEAAVRTDPGTGSIGPLQLGHVLISDGTGVPMWSRRSPDPGWSGYSSETAESRIARVCREEGIPVTVVGGQSSTELATQPVGRVIDIVRQAEETDLGLLHDAGPAGALVYLSRSALFNRPPAMVVRAGGDTGQLAQGFTAQLPDSETVNDVTVSRDGGASAREVDEDSVATVGRTEQSATLAVCGDTQLQDQARWRLHLAERSRVQWGSILVDLRAHPELVGPWMGCGVAGRVQIPDLHMEPTAPTIDCDLIVGKHAEKLSMTSWTVEMECAEYAAYKVFQIGSNDVGRFDTEESQLQYGISSGDITFTVTSGTYPWVSTASDPGAFPFDVEIGGERMTVTGIVGDISPQTFAVVRAVNSVSSAHSAGDQVRLWSTGVIAL